MTTNLFLSKDQQEERLRELAVSGDSGGIAALLKRPAPGFDINSPDQKGRSALFLALESGQAGKNPAMISLLLTQGAIIKNGKVLPPRQLPKLLTQQASARVLHRVFKSIAADYGASAFRDQLLLEVGSGDGYLKYLLSLIHDPVLENIGSRLVETEYSADVVYQNRLKGKHTINKGIAQLPAYFGSAFTPAVISLNVMDTFSREELTTHLKAIYELLQPGGIFLHVMSSSIHRHIFAQLEASGSNQLSFPYSEAGYIGLRLVSRGTPFPGPGSPPASISADWCDLFMKNPAQYVELARQFTAQSNETGNHGTTVLFKDFFLGKINAAFDETGFKRIYQDEVSASLQVKKNRFHRQIPEANYFENKLGLIITDTYPLDGREPESVIEKSTFLVVIGQKC
jgi:hypothetical protein